MKSVEMFSWVLKAGYEEQYYVQTASLKAVNEESTDDFYSLMHSHVEFT